MNVVTRLFPLWALLFSVIAYLCPASFAEAKAAIIPLLSVVMFCMGLTLRWQNFADVLNKPLIIFIGVFLQYALMPFLAWAIALALQLPAELMLGMILVGASAGGTASNVICYLAGGNVALSILMTMLSTLLSLLFMPLLTWLYLQTTVDVPVLKMLQSIASIVLAPVLLGTLINSLFSARLSPIKDIFPSLSSVAIILIIAIIIGINQENLQTMASGVVTAVILHNGAGLGCAYFIMRGLHYDKVIARTIAIEVGMQNSGLSVALAVKHFSALAALPGAVFSIWHNLSGSLLAFVWQQQDRRLIKNHGDVAS